MSSGRGPDGVGPDGGDETVGRRGGPTADDPGGRAAGALLVPVALGGVLGALARVGVEDVLDGLPGAPLVAVVLVDVLGALALGLLVGAGLPREGHRLRKGRPAPTSRLALAGTGALGSFTTVSALAVGVAEPDESLAPSVAVLLLAVALGLGLLAARWGLARAPSRGRPVADAVLMALGLLAVVGLITEGPGAALLVALGAVAGATARHVVVHRTGPLGVVAVNAVGTALLGLLVGAADGGDVLAAPLLAAGLCGSLTTFSTAAVDVARAPRGWGGALGVAHVVGGLGAAVLGLAAGGAL